MCIRDRDMPDEPAAGLTFAKAWKREDPRDVLVLKNAASLDELPHGAVIGTGSKRRKYPVSYTHLGGVGTGVCGHLFLHRPLPVPLLPH